MDCINPTIAGEVNPFFAGEDTAGGPCPYEPSTVEITYEICNGDNQYDLFLDQEKTRLKYDSTNITPTSIFASPIAPNECVFHVHEVTWDMCDVPAIGESVFPYSIIAEGYLKRDDPFVDETGKQVDAGGKAGDPFPDSENKYCSCKLIDADSLCQLSMFPMCSLFSLFYNHRLHFPSFLIRVQVYKRRSL